LVVFIFVNISQLTAQKEDYNWIIGNINIADYCSPNNAWGEAAIPTILTFNTDPPSWSQNKDITLDFSLTNATYSNAEGELICYSNGMSIYGYDHKPIAGGDTISYGPLDDSSCDTLGIDNNPVSKFRYEQDTIDFLAIDFVDLSFYEPTDWEWDFGDGTTSNEQFPFHQYMADDAYEVCLTVSNQFSADVSCDTLYLGVSSLDDIEEPRHISLFPNPVEDNTRVAIHDYLPQDARIMFYDIQRREVQSLELETTSQLIDLSGLSDGIYFYTVMDGGVILSSGKVVKI